MATVDKFGTSMMKTMIDATKLGPVQAKKATAIVQKLESIDRTKKTMMGGSVMLQVHFRAIHPDELLEQFKTIRSDFYAKHSTLTPSSLKAFIADGEELYNSMLAAIPIS